MIVPLLWLIYLLTYSETDAQCLVADDGLVQMVPIDIGFSDEDRILMKNLNVFTALHGMQTRYSDENSVHLSLCQTRAL